MLGVRIGDFKPPPNRVVTPRLFVLSPSFSFLVPFPPPPPAHAPCLSPHVWYVKVLFPCPGATYTQGKHRAVCVDDCQQWSFIICQASVLWGGKYTQWIMVVLVCRRNPTWQPAEGRDKIVYEEIVYHGHGKHCPSNMRRAVELRLWRDRHLKERHVGAGVDAWETWFNTMVGKKQHNHYDSVVSHLLTVGSIHVFECWCVCLEKGGGVSWGL